MSVDDGKLRVGQLGAQFELKALDVIVIDNVKILIPFDLSLATVVEIIFTNNTTSSITKTAVKESRGTKWYVTYQDPVGGSSLLTISGLWTMRIVATLSTGEKIPLHPALFTVGP